MESDLQFNDVELDELEIYKYRLGSTARQAVAPSSAEQAKYMNSKYEPLGMDPVSAYFSLMGLMGPGAIYDSVYPDEEQNEDEYLYYPDGLRGRDVVVDDYRGEVKLERLIDVAQEVGLLNIQEAEVFNPQELDAGERMLEAAQKIELASRLLCVEPQDLVVVLDGCEREAPIIVQEEVEKYVSQVEGQKDCGYCLYTPGLVTSAGAEDRAECLDILNLSYHLGFKYVKLPPYMSDHKSLLENSGLIVTFFVPDEDREPDVLYWHGRTNVGGILPADARYVKYSDIEDDHRYYPSLVYGRGYAISCLALTSGLIPGLRGTELRSSIRENFRNMRRSVYKGCVYYDDPYRSFFCLPLSATVHVIDLPKDKRRKLQYFPTKKEIQSELRGLLTLNNNRRLDNYKQLMDEGRMPPGHLCWVMLLGFERYSDVFYQVYDLRRQEEQLFPRRHES